MTDISSLQSDILAQIAASGDEAALEAVRVAALGKKGSVSELMKTLGAMSPSRSRLWWIRRPRPNQTPPGRIGDFGPRLLLSEF